MKQNVNLIQFCEFGLCFAFRCQGHFCIETKRSWSPGGDGGLSCFIHFNAAVVNSSGKLINKWKVGKDLFGKHVIRNRVFLILM